jgi:predicted ABC-type ATPase
MFAGPNGSGKTTIKNGLGKPSEWFGTYVNPDDLERDIRATGTLSLEALAPGATADEVRLCFASSSLLRARGLDGDAAGVSGRGGRVEFRDFAFNSYHASVLADFLRRKALEQGRSFSFETVMSSPDKVELLREARLRGFRTYLYFVATEDPAINVHRVRNRVAEGGHDVPEDKIVGRYHRSLALLPDAIPHMSRACFFDSSGSESWYFAEAADGIRLKLKSDEMPRWFAPVWERFGPEAAIPIPPPADRG